MPTDGREDSQRALPALTRAIRWFLKSPGALPDALPFYCDRERVGAFRIRPEDLAAGSDATIFQLFVTLSMYQALRDAVIMRQQRSLSRPSMRAVADARLVKGAIGRQRCSVLLSADTFDKLCDVWKSGTVVDCHRSTGQSCHVKDATVVFNRMGDMGKLPTSAWLRFWKDGGLRKHLAGVFRDENSPHRRAALLVEHFSRVYRVGRKLATLFVSALSTPALAPGLTPWFPDVDGNELVVIDTNVARAVDALRHPGAPRTYDARDRWIRERAYELDLRQFRSDLPSYSPRLLQQALYAFCSKSNRVEQEDACTTRQTPCERCAAELCPFVPARAAPRSTLRGLHRP